MPKRFFLRRQRYPEVIYMPPELRRVRTVPRRMLSPTSLVLIGVGGVLAIVFGVSLGNSAISQINPLYFRGAAVHPRDRGAAIDPNAPTVIPNRYEQLYGFAQGQQARATDCVGCSFASPAMPDRALVHEASAPYFGSREENARNEAQEQRRIDALYQARLDDAEARRTALADVQRYTRYRVSDDEVVRERPSYAQHDVVLSDEDDAQK